MYKYARSKVPTGPWTVPVSEFDNGDIGIVIIKKTIGIQVDKVAPICLPVPAAYEKKSALDVRFVGWGYRTSYGHFCETNGAREPNHQLYPNTGGISIVECDYKNSRKKFCQGGKQDSNGLSSRKIKTFSYQTKIVLNKNMIDKIESNPSYKKCVVYMESAANKWASAKMNLNPFKTHEGKVSTRSFKRSNIYI